MLLMYCVSYAIKIDRNENKKKFFCFAKNETEATERFCNITGQSKETITQIKEVKKWDC